MEAKFNFNSKVCTDRSQSERLLALGLKKETADCHYDYSDGKWKMGEGCNSIACENLYPKYYIPAWSLHRLIEMTKLKVTPFLYGVEISHPQWERAFVKRANVWDNLCDCIEWLINEGYFNKKYLCEK